jgi:hypothetical protein
MGRVRILCCGVMREEQVCSSWQKFYQNYSLRLFKAGRRVGDILALSADRPKARRLLLKASSAVG